MDHREKRELREHKRRVKRAGNQRIRRQVKRALSEIPDEASDLQTSYGRFRSSDLNGLDRSPAPWNHEAQSGFEVWRTLLDRPDCAD